MRDHIKNESYFFSYINTNTVLLEKLEKGLANAGTDVQKKRRYSSAITISKYGLIKAKYSAGFPVTEVKKQYMTFLKDMYDIWMEDSSMLYMYDMMSLAVLFDISKEEYLKLYQLVRKYKREDALTKFFSEYMLNNNVMFLGDVSYGYPYDRLKDIITNKEDRLKNLKIYIKDDWYKGNHEAFWYDTHKNKKESYYGYWSFEAGAIARILKIDDSSLKDVPYYPYDLVHYENK